MARPLRIEYPDALYHVTCRGNEKRVIYRDDKDRVKFLEILQRSIEIYNIKVYSYVLMLNHFHVLIKTPLGNLSLFMRHFNITYTSYFNRRYKRGGHLYQGRFKSLLIDSDEYFSMVSRYIHLNPVRVRVKVLSRKSDDEKFEYLENYKWSSFPGYIFKSKTDEFIDYEPILIEFGGVNAKGRRGYKKLLYYNMTKGLEIKEDIVGQCILGGEKFVRWVKEDLLNKEADKERPQLIHLQSYKNKESIIEAIEKETGKPLELIKAERGALRQMTMDLLYRLGGLNGREIGEMFNISYSAVSQERKRLKKKTIKDGKLQERTSRIETYLSTIKI